MDIRNFMNENVNLSYDEIKTILEKKHKLKVILDYNKDFYMIISTNMSNFEDKFIRQCTGTIIEKKSNNILHYFSEKSYDTINNFNNNIIEKKDVDTKNCFVSPYIDGHVIKIFHYKNEWIFSTSKHTNIKYFKINNISLYSIFESCILKCFHNMSDFLNSLDHNYCYTLILNKEKGLFLINKVFLSNFTEYFNLTNFKTLDFYNNNKLKINDEDKFIVIEKKDNIIIKRICLPGKHLKKLFNESN